MAQGESTTKLLFKVFSYDADERSLMFKNESFRLISIEVTSLEDVYWLEDSRASQILGKDFAAWNHVRQKLPTSKAQLEILKAELWSTVVKTSNHKDAWTYGGMLVVSVSVAGLVTLGTLNDS